MVCLKAYHPPCDVPADYSNVLRPVHHKRPRRLILLHFTAAAQILCDVERIALVGIREATIMRAPACGASGAVGDSSPALGRSPDAFPVSR